MKNVNFDSIHARVFRQALKTPQAAAIQDLSGILNYQQLLELAAGTASRLKSLVLEKETPVGVFCPRDRSLIGALLGVLAADCAYLPLDLKHPPSYIKQLLELTKANYVITTPELANQLPNWITPVYIDSLGKGVADISIEQYSRAVTDQLAYFIFTSGTNGTPKAVMIEHGNTLSLIDWAQRVYDAQDLSEVAAATSITFDISVFEIFVTLSLGGCVHVLEDPLALVRWPRKDELTLLNTVPSVMSEILDMISLPRQLRVVNLAGEPFPKRLFDAIHKHRPSVRIYNLYGPSEDTTYSTSDCILESDETPTIGRSLTGRRHYLLNSQNQEVDVGEIGEIYLAGPGVARGYYQRPDLNQAFLPDLMDSKLRMYRTGDFARRLPDGRLLYVGRRDDQIKIRGQRIELGEVHAALLAHPEVNDAALVIMNSIVKGTIIRCAVQKKHPFVSNLQEQLITYLRSRIPHAMIPSEWIILDALPRLLNGKIDRSLISKMELTYSPELGQGQAPQGPWEIQLGELWKDLLQVPDVFADNTFLGLGGNSLLIAKLAFQIEKKFGIVLHPAVLLENAALRDQASLLNKCLNQTLVLGGKRETESRVELHDVAPCSDSQVRFWTLEKLIPNSPRYNIVHAFQVKGALDVERLENAISNVMDRHPILSVRYQQQGGFLQQVRQPRKTQVLDCMSVNHLDPSFHWPEALRLAEEFARRGFSISDHSWLRVLCVSISESLHLLVLVSHHIAADGSMDIILRDLSRFYNQPNAFGESSEDFDYLCYSALLKHPTQSASSTDSLAYWKQMFESVPHPLNLPRDKPPRRIPTDHGQTWINQIPNETYLSLKAICIKNQVSLFQGLLAVCWAYFSKLCDTQDVTIATPVQIRPSKLFENTVGNFVNTCLLRGNLESTESLQDILKVAQKRTTEAMIHSSTPLETVLEGAQLKGSSLNGSSLNVMFSVVEAFKDLTLGDSVSKRIPIELNTSRFELGMFFQHTKEGLELHLEYSKDSFSETRALALSEYLIHFLETAVKNELGSWRNISLLPDSELNRVIFEWNQTSAPYSQDKLIHQLFESSVDRSADRIAIISDQESLSYGQLESRSNQLAHLLMAQGLCYGDRVAILCDRSPWMIVSILAVLKAGCVYVPMDPASPDDRLLTMLQIAEIRAILYDDPYLEKAKDLRKGAQNRVLTVYAQASALINTADFRPNATIISDELAYIIFTSGTTGRPKAVKVRHRPVINLIEWVNQTFSVDSHDRLLFVTPIAFDLSVYDIFGILAAGGSIRIASAQDTKDPSRLAKILAEEPITFWDSAPIALDQCLPYLKENASQALRLVFLSGDWIPVPLFEKLKRSFPAVKLIALGGATEAVIWSNFYQVEKVEPGQNSIPYGKPIQNARYYILDKSLQPVPVGVEGDLYIGGEVLADGYYGDLEKTKKQFLKDPFLSDPVSRMYRTGDRARFFEDGTIEFRGRLDTQVKINGYRIEVGEIEGALLSQPEVEAVHVAVKGVRHQYWLCAYIVGKGLDGNVIDTLRSRLRKKLPEYMLPSVFIPLEALPLSANGKLNAALLPDPAQAQLKKVPKLVNASYYEQEIRKIWKEVLQHSDFGLNDNFFDVGGNSARLILTHRKIEAFLVTSMPITTLFQHTSIKDLAKYLKSYERKV